MWGQRRELKRWLRPNLLLCTACILLGYALAVVCQPQAASYHNHEGAARPTHEERAVKIALCKDSKDVHMAGWMAQILQTYQHCLQTRGTFYTCTVADYCDVLNAFTDPCAAQLDADLEQLLYQSRMWEYLIQQGICDPPLTNHIV
jgi:hypothetical protein